MNNLVNTLIFDLTIKNREDNFGFQQMISALVKEKVVPILEIILNKSVGLDETVIIDQLTLDLETLSIEYLDEDLETRIRHHLSSILVAEIERLRGRTTQNEILKDKLAAQLSNMSQPESSNNSIGGFNQILANPEKNISLFLHYIYRGHFPWWADHSIYHDFGLHTLRLAENNPGLFAAIIKDIIIKKDLLPLIRVINYFEDKFLDIFTRNAGASLLDKASEYSHYPRMDAPNVTGNIHISKREQRWVTKLLNALMRDAVHLPTKNDHGGDLNSIQNYFPHKMISIEEGSEKGVFDNITPAKKAQEAHVLEHEKIPVYNCGLVLTGVFLQSFFNKLCLLEDSKFISHEHRNKAAYLLQYLVTGREHTPEYELTLNKVLCGLDIAWPLQKTKITREEKKEADNLLQSMIKHWKELKNISIEGFRNSFLKRPGVLDSMDGFWQLRVEGKSYDMLLDKLPWTISIINQPWLIKPVHVEWQ